MEQPYESPAFSNSWQIYGDSPRLDPSTVFSLWCHHGTDSLGVSCEYNNIRVLLVPFLKWAQGAYPPYSRTTDIKTHNINMHRFVIKHCSPSPPPTHKHACMRAHAHTPIYLRQAGSVRSREKVNLELWLQGRQSFEHVTQRNGGSWWRDNERKSVLSLKFIASVWNTKYTIISRGAESARWQVQFKVRKVRRSSVSDHTVADCSSLFCILLATSANPQKEG